MNNVQLDYLDDRRELIPQLAQWHFNEWSYLHADDSVERRVAELEDSCRRDELPIAFVASAARELLGSSMLVAHDMDTHTDLSPWLASVFVAPTHRRRGIATALVARVVEAAAALRFPRIYLFTPSEELFYAKRGWTLFGREVYHGVDVTVMTMALPQ
jgi:GNAT superfamily N-acetyltransferase